MLEFVSQENFKVGNRGTAYVTTNPTECQSFKYLIGMEVSINGIKHTVIGVEGFMHAPPWRAGEKISLLVK